MSETVDHPSRRCPRCGRELPPDAPEGLCARCLLAVGMETLTASIDATSTGGAFAASQPPGAPRLVDGQLWGAYRVIRLLGRGGMGEVYEAEQLETGRRLALKMLRATLRGNEDRARFLREGQLAASISHPHTVYIFGSEEIGGSPAITMELLPGGTLKDRVAAEGPLPPSAAVSAVLDILGGLDAAHAAGILHRDVKPSNCFVDKDGAVKIGDFGLSISTLTRDVKNELATAGFEGTPQFAAPEQLRGEPLDARADIYAVGATLYYLLTGRPPFDAADFGSLVAMAASETPASPRALRSEIPRGLAAVVLQCLAKSPAARPQSYPELADLLRPFGSADVVPAPLGTRFVAWLVDAAVFAIVTWLLTVSAWAGATPGSATILQLLALPWLTGTIYYFVLEGCWGASLGKRLMGLRVTSRPTTGWWPRIAVRSAAFHIPLLVPALFLMGATRGSTIHGVTYSTNAAPNGWTWNAPTAPPDALLTMLLTVLLFSTARRRNGWTGVHELLSGTRVVQPNLVRSVRSAAPRAAAADAVSALSSLRRVGPYIVQTAIGDTGTGRLFVGIDPILRRHVWIHEVPSETPAVDATRRDASRPGRLYWLAGRRSDTENWDAYEAPRGEPFLSAPPASEWREAHRALSSLAIELEASVRDDAKPHPTLAHVWKRDDGQLVLLDFPWPASSSEARKVLTPVALLAAVAARAFFSPMTPTAPLSATTLLNRLASATPPALAEVKAELVRLGSIPRRPSRVRRAVPMVLAAIPVAVPIAAVTVIIPSFTQGSGVEILMWMTWITDSNGDGMFKTSEQQTAAEQYVAAHFRSQLTSDEFWNTRMPQAGSFAGMRQRAEEIAARYPAVPADDLARASAILAPQIQEVARWRSNFVGGREALRRFVASGFVWLPVSLSIVFGLMSALAVPGGLVTRALRHAVVRRDGSEIGRVHSAVRFLIAWCPVIAGIAYVGHPMFGLRATSPGTALAVDGLSLAVMAAGAVWTIAMPLRGPHDRIAGTWVVPR